MEFKAGDLIVGKDQSYDRSIYEITRIREVKGKKQALMLWRGLRGMSPQSKKEKITWLHWRNLDEFLKADMIALCAADVNPDVLLCHLVDDLEARGEDLNDIKACPH